MIIKGKDSKGKFIRNGPTGKKHYYNTPEGKKRAMTKVGSKAGSFRAGSLRAGSLRAGAYRAGSYRAGAYRAGALI
jgi:hypothetical protein